MNISIEMALYKKALPDREYLKENLDYNPETGIFTWKNRTGKQGRVRDGDEAGCQSQWGYINIGIGGKNYSAHRIAWKWMTGEDPTEFDIDHIDRQPWNNTFSNLRLATRSENLFNKGERLPIPAPRKKRSRRLKRVNETTAKSGYRGVTRSPYGKWVVRAKVNGKKTHVGTYDTAEEASKAYEEFRRQVPPCKPPGRRRK